MTAGAAQRRTQLAANLAAVSQRIAVACAAAGRAHGDVTLVVVTKTWPVGDVRLLAELGVHDFGENRQPEALVKVAECADLIPAPRWHFVGQLQRNKAAVTARFADVVHSVDRVAVATALDRGAARWGRHVDVFVQVSLGPAAGALGPRGGAAPGDVAAVADAVAAATNLRLVGLMAVAPPATAGDPAAAFDRLAGYRQAFLADHPQAGALSAGMSADLEPAIAAGATHVRVGSAVLGQRDNVR